MFSEVCNSIWSEVNWFHWKEFYEEYDFITFWFLSISKRNQKAYEQRSLKQDEKKMCVHNLFDEIQGKNN